MPTRTTRIRGDRTGVYTRVGGRALIQYAFSLQHAPPTGSQSTPQYSNASHSPKSSSNRVNGGGDSTAAESTTQELGGEMPSTSNLPKAPPLLDGFIEGKSTASTLSAPYVKRIGPCCRWNPAGGCSCPALENKLCLDVPLSRVAWNRCQILTYAFPEPGRIDHPYRAWGDHPSRGPAKTNLWLAHPSARISRRRFHHAHSATSATTETPRLLAQRGHQPEISADAHYLE